MVVDEQRPEAAMDLTRLKPGFKFLDRYEIEKRFAEQGSGGTVYLVKDTCSVSSECYQERRVIKIFQGEDQRGFYEREHNSLTAVTKLLGGYHPGIVRLIEGDIICGGWETLLVAKRRCLSFRSQLTPSKVHHIT